MVETEIDRLIHLTHTNFLWDLPSPKPDLWDLTTVIELNHWEGHFGWSLLVEFREVVRVTAGSQEEFSSLTFAGTILMIHSARKHRHVMAYR